MSSTRYVHPDEVPEKVGWAYTGTLKDEAGAVIPAATFASLTVTIYALDTARTVIQASTSILNVGRGVLTAGGVLTITFTPADSAMVDVTKPREKHVALVQGVYSTTRQFAREIEFTIRNLEVRV
jgi:hypothetical protein